MEENEVINLIISIILFVFLYKQFKSTPKHIPNLWLYSVILIVLGDVSTVVEGYFYFTLFNILEHSLFSLSCLLFLLGTIQLKKVNT